MKNLLFQLTSHIEHFVNQHRLEDKEFFSGDFSLFQNSLEYDLYGSIDAVYILYTTGILEKKTDQNSRSTWAKKILDCQGKDGWFTKKNLRGHAKEHATAYALSALQLLSIEDEEKYINLVNPIQDIRSFLEDKNQFLKWIKNLDFELKTKSILQKKLGWHHIWRGSHVGGGIAAIIGMTNHLFSNWWDIKNSVEMWYSWYFDWLNDKVNPETGLWQLGVWNKIYKNPTLIDMGGAVHFYWIYEKLGQSFPYPENLIESTLSLQKNSGLYKNHPFCIDLDGNFCVIRAYLQLSDDMKNKFRERVYQSAERSFEGIVNAFLEKPLSEIYKDSHGLPGALAALVECKKLPGFKYAELIRAWEHPLDKTWWL